MLEASYCAQQRSYDGAAAVPPALVLAGWLVAGLVLAAIATGRSRTQMEER